MPDDSNRWQLDLDRVQELAQLDLDADARERLERDLRRILRFAAEMGEGSVAEDADPPRGRERLRGGEIHELEARRWQGNAPDLRDGWFVIPDRSDRS